MRTGVSQWGKDGTTFPLRGTALALDTPAKRTGLRNCRGAQKERTFLQI